MASAYSDLADKIIPYLILGMISYAGLTLRDVSSTQVALTVELAHMQKTIDNIERTSYTIDDSIHTSNRISGLERQIEILTERIRSLEKQLASRNGP